MKLLLNRWAVIFVFIAIIGGLLFSSYDLNTKNETESLQDLYYILTTALASGLIVALVQFLLDLKRQKQIDDFAAMGIKNILDSRDNEALYSKIITSTQERIWIMGSTSSRLLTDFADYRENKSKKRGLIQALGKGVQVKILVTEKRYLPTEKDKQNFDIAKKRFVELKKEFPENFNIRYYKHIPTHSIFVFDYECFVGPIFKELNSSETPSIHAKTGIDYSKKYLEHFEQEWNEAVPL